MKIIRIFFGLIKKYLLGFKLKKTYRRVENIDLIEHKATVSKSIFSDANLKCNDKLYLIILIMAFDNTLGYSQISNKNIMNAASCSNNNTIINAINRLEKNKYIKRLENKKGKIGKYKILKHIEFVNIDNSNDIFSNKECDYNLKDIKGDTCLDIKIESKDEIRSKGDESKSNATSLLKNIQNKIRTSNETLEEFIDKINIIDEEIDVFLNENY